MRTNDEILNEWEKRVLPDSGIIRDGIINQDLWAAAKRKVLFLLKEGYTKDDEGGKEAFLNKGWDLCDDLREAYRKNEFYGNTLREAAYWAHGIINAKGTFSPRLSEVEENQVISSFASTAVVNVKKTPGGTSSSWEDLMAEVSKHQDLLQEQINTIKPGIIICGNVWSLIEKVFTVKKTLFDCVYLCEGDLVFVDYCHPANRSSRGMKYYALESLLRGAKVI